MKIAAIINGSSFKAKQAQKELASQAKATIFFTKKASETNLFAQQVLDQEFDVVIVAGGDGTINQVINTWFHSGKETLPKIALFPTGSANDFNRSLEFKGTKKLLANLKAEKFIPIDVLKLDAKGEKHYTLNLANNGLGAEIARTVLKRRLIMPSSVNYFSATALWLLRFRPPMVEIQIDDYQLKLRTFLTSIGNGKYSGDGLCLCPQANLNDGKMAITLIGKVNLFDFIRYLPFLKNSKKVNDKRAIYHTVSRVKIRVLEGKLAVETDGEFRTRLKVDETVTYVVMPSALSFIQP